MEKFEMFLRKLTIAHDSIRKTKLAIIKMFYRDQDRPITEELINNTITVIKQSEEELKELKQILQVKKNKV